MEKRHGWPSYKCFNHGDVNLNIVCVYAPTQPAQRNSFLQSLHRFFFTHASLIVVILIVTIMCVISLVAVTIALQDFCPVHSVHHQLYPDSTIHTGTRIVHMIRDVPIARHLYIEGCPAKVWYRGQPTECVPSTWQV